MSKSTSPRAAKRNWPELLSKAQEADRQLTAEELALWQRGLIDGQANGWHVDLVHALQRAFEGRDHAPLLGWLDAGMPIPAFLSPLIGDVVRALTQGTISGAGSKLSAHDDASIRIFYDKLTNLDTKRGPGTRAKIDLASAYGVSVDTIENSLKRTLTSN